MLVDHEALQKLIEDLTVAGERSNSLWAQMPCPEGGRAFQTILEFNGSRSIILVVDFDLTDQGFTGKRGYEGTVMGAGQFTIMRLPRPNAERLFKAAEKSVA